LIPAGTGLAFHEERRKRQAHELDAVAVVEQGKSAEIIDAEAALKQALKAE
jgi:DNA-directed RNA polymerase subunit beta'